jgi:hypothetical protein
MPPSSDFNSACFFENLHTAAFLFRGFADTSVRRLGGRRFSLREKNMMMGQKLAAMGIHMVFFLKFPLFSRILRCKIPSSNVCLPDTKKEVLYGEHCRQPNH